jgi:arylsulfatase A-like enzyme
MIKGETMLNKTLSIRWLSAILLISLSIGLFENAIAQEKPNIVVLLMDDVGYGDLSSYGHPIIKTPNMDRLGEEGIRFTSFVTAMWCTPTRTQLMTGRYMPRIDFGGGTGSDGTGGLPDSEVTIAQSLKDAGYTTGMAGKWHLGYMQDKYLPPNKGFDSWFGIPYSNDYRKPWVQTDEPLGLFRGTEMVEFPINQNTLTKRYTEEAVNFINDNSNSEKPFFFYLAYNMAHLPIFTTDEFQGTSDAGLYGDVMNALDWSVGEVLAALQENGVDENTIVFLTSDNGPWLNLPDRMLAEGVRPWHQGTTGLLRGAKHTSYEGGNRVPAIIRWPGKITSGLVTHELVGMPDIYRTFMALGDAELPNHTLDGYDLTPFLMGEDKESPRNEYAYFRGELEAMRIGDWKLRLASGEPELFNLNLDPSELYNRVNEDHEIAVQIYQNMLELAEEVGVNVSESNIKVQ